MKKKVSRKLLVLLLALVMVLSLVGCSEEPAEETSNGDEDETVTEEFNPDDYSIAVCMDNMNHPVHRIVQLGFLHAAEELGYKNAKVIGTEGGDQSEAFAAAEAFAAEGGNGLLMWVGDAGGHETIASVANQEVIVGVPHFNHEQEDGSYPDGLAFNMACDPVLYGQQVAELMAEKLSGKTGSIALTQNTKNITENSAIKSFNETWNSLVDKDTYELDNIKILDAELEGGVIDSATAVNLAIIQSNSDIIGAFGTTGNSPITWADAAEKAGRSVGEILIVGMDATEGNLDYLEEGKVAALVAQPLYQEAYKTMEYLDMIFRGETVPQWTDLSAPIVTVDGKGENGLEFHRKIAAEVQTFFK